MADREAQEGAPRPASMGWLAPSKADFAARAKAPLPVTLRLCRSCISDADVAVLARNTTLEYLTLNCCAIGDASAKALALSTTLHTLYVGRTAIGDAGAAALARSTSLRRLYARSCAIGDAGVAALALSTTLRELYVAQNRITDVGAAALACALEKGNACALLRAELRSGVMRRIGRRASSILARYLDVATGNQSLRVVQISLNRDDAAQRRIAAALRARRSWRN
jgi:hypothetical protein